MSIKLRATPDMDTRDCAYVNAQIRKLVGALEYALDCTDRNDYSDMQPVRDALREVQS